MNPGPDLPRSNETDGVLDDLFDQLTAKVQAGEPVDVEAYAREYPEQADRLRSLVPAIQALADLVVASLGFVRQPAGHGGESARRNPYLTWPTHPRAVAETRAPRDLTAEEREIFELEEPSNNTD